MPRIDPDHCALPQDDLLGFIHVPAGKFIMGGDNLTEDEKPGHEVNLPEFWMARFPVTVAQYRVYCEYRGCEDIIPETLHFYDDHPVVHVTWDQALAYCRWINGNLVKRAKDTDHKNPLWEGLAEGKLRVTLPSEAEWEKCARGTDGRIYPWGDKFDTRRLNIDETGIGTTSAVGCFPLGASPYGALDMAGNVWEWTRSLMGEWDEEKDEFLHKYTYPYIPTDGREDLDGSTRCMRIIRGSSFAHDRSDTPCAYRGWDHPDTSCEYIGFRIAVSNC